MKKLSARNRLMALGFGALGLVIIAWKLSFAKTLEAYQSLQENSLQLVRLSKAPALAAEYQKQISDFDNREKSKEYDREILFEFINTFCLGHGIQILKFHPEQRVSDLRFELITNKLEVQGSFKEIVKLGWNIEREERLGHIASASYQYMEDKRTHKTALVGRFTIQHYLQNNKNAPN